MEQVGRNRKNGGVLIKLPKIRPTAQNPQKLCNNPRVRFCDLRRYENWVRRPGLGRLASVETDLVHHQWLLLACSSFSPLPSTEVKRWNATRRIGKCLPSVWWNETLAFLCARRFCGMINLIISAFHFRAQGNPEYWSFFFFFWCFGWYHIRFHACVIGGCKLKLMNMFWWNQTSSECLHILIVQTLMESVMWVGDIISFMDSFF